MTKVKSVQKSSEKNGKVKNGKKVATEKKVDPNRGVQAQELREKYADRITKFLSEGGKLTHRSEVGQAIWDFLLKQKAPVSMKEICAAVNEDGEQKPTHYDFMSRQITARLAVKTADGFILTPLGRGGNPVKAKKNRKK